jgi:hypothetical protein
MNKEPLQFLTPVVGILSIVLLVFVGQGISGAYIVGFFILLVLATFLATTLKIRRAKSANTSEVIPYVKFGFEAESLMLVGGLLLWITLLDFFIIETFKLLNYSFATNTYWVILFGGIVPVAVVAMALAFYIGSQNMANTLRLVILSLFVFHSNVLDLLYYKLFSHPFPTSWPWLYQPKFLFGDAPSTHGVIAWVVIGLVMAVVSFILPYENFTPDKIDLKYDANLPKFNKRLNITLVACFFLFVIVYAIPMIGNIKNSLSVQQTATYGTPVHTDLAISKSDFEPQTSDATVNTVSTRFTDAQKIISLLNDDFNKKGAYPVSKGNCDEQWDSSYNKLPFEVDGAQVKDPEQASAKDCKLTKDSKNIWYYSDGNSFALMMSGEAVPASHNQNVYTPGTRDVRWFTKDILFYRDWKWNGGIPFLVFMYVKGNEVTTFQ